MSVASSAKLLRVAATAINLLVRAIAVSSRVERMIAGHAFEAAPVIRLGNGD